MCNILLNIQSYGMPIKILLLTVINLVVYCTNKTIYPLCPASGVFMKSSLPLFLELRWLDLYALPPCGKCG